MCSSDLRKKMLHFARGTLAIPPPALDPSSPQRLVGLLGGGLLLHKLAFQAFRRHRGGTIGWLVFSSKLLARFGIVGFLLARFAVVSAEKRAAARGSGGTARDPGTAVGQRLLPASPRVRARQKPL